MGGSQNRINKQLEQDRNNALIKQNQLLEKATADTPELLRWREQSGQWDDWLKAKDYSQGPEGSMLNFDLWNPAHVQAQTAKMSNLEGVGAASMAGQGDTSIALAQTKERNANEAAQNAGQAYEQAVGQQDAYFKGANPSYMTAETAKFNNLFGQQSANTSNATGSWLDFKSTPSAWERLLNSGIQAAGSIGMGAFGKKGK